MDESDVYVLYGSQTGNSEQIAKDLSLKLIDYDLKSKCMPLNLAKKIDLKNVSKVVIVVCSTTGNGDCPENGDLWWRSVKLRSVQKDLFTGLSYAVLGLGDTNYDKFCHMGKSIDKRMEELGGNRILKLCCADEAVGLDDTVEKWKTEVIQVLKHYLVNKEKSLGQDSSYYLAKVENDELSISEALNSLKVKDNEHQIVLPSGIMDPSQICRFLGLSDKFSSTPSSSQLPRIKAINPVCAFPIDENHKLPKNVNNLFADEWSVDNPFSGAVLSASYLTENDLVSQDAWDEVRIVIQIEVSIEGSNIQYSPGDSIGICCPNPHFHVDVVYQRLKQYYLNQKIDLNLDSKVLDPNTGACSSLQDLLMYRYDLTGVPKKTSLLTLSKYCSNPDEELFMQWLCSKTDVGKRLWTAFIEDQRVGLAELLALVPSCFPPLEVLITCMTPQPPRFYSIASSPLAHPKSIVFVFSVVRYICHVNQDQSRGPTLRRFGVCTNYLERLLSPFLVQSADNIHNSINIKLFHKTTINFHLPGSAAHPLILIGPGTGVAPFIGFLEHIERSSYVRSKSGDEISTGVWRGSVEVDNLPCEGGYVGQYIQKVMRGPVYLFFGCRGPSDYLFRAYLEEKVKDDVITGLEVAMSRVGPEKKYVTHKLLERGAEICDLILKQGAYVYICGDGNNMAKSVCAAVKQIFKEYGKMSETEAEETFEDLKHRRRFLLDIWS